MTTRIQKLLGNSLTFVVMVWLLAGCAPPAGSPQQPGFPSRDTNKVLSALELHEESLRTLTSQFEQLKEEQLKQAAAIEKLKRSKQDVGRSSRQEFILPKATWDNDGQGPSEGTPTEVYLQAFGDYASGRYQAAIHGFESFLQKYPNNSYASNAQFWLADSYFNQQQYATSIVEFQHVINNYQAAAKNPDALYKVAIAQLQLGKPDEARIVIELLQRRYPKSTAAQKAQELVIP